MTLESLPQHVRKPDLRPVQPIPVTRGKQQLVALRDPTQLTAQTIVVPPQAMVVLQQFRGELAIEEIARQLNGDVDQFVELAQGLDKVGLLWGPTFRGMEAEAKARIAAEGFPPGASQSLGKTEAECRTAIDGYMAETEDPEVSADAVAIVSPHLDYERGWPNYAASYYPWREAAPPDRVVVLGTNHFGLGDGVVVTEYDFQTPMGACPTDKALVAGLTDKLGDRIVIDQLDHLAEHSIQLHLPWLQYCFGDLQVLAALIPDPLAPMIKDDGARIEGGAFAESLAGVLDALGGRTLFVASADLSHVGPQFGEPRAVDDQRRHDVELHDRDMMATYLRADAEEFLAAFRWNRNPTRWCSIGNMAVALQLARPATVELIDYRQACDDKGTNLVSSCAMALYH